MNRRLLQLVSLAAAVVLAGCSEDPISAPSPRAKPPGAQPLLVAAPFFTYVSAGDSHTCALRNDGVIECWGDNTFGQAPATRSASGRGYFTWVSSSRFSDTCGARSDGSVECWGRNEFGAAPSSRVPAELTPGFGGFFTSVSVGTIVACAVRRDGIIECWGGREESPLAPPIKKSLTGAFVDVSVGGGHACALRSDGAVECWGNNFYGQAPSEKIPAVGRYASVQASDNHACALRSDSVIECWGGSEATFPPATMVSSIPDLPFYNMTTGPSHICGVRLDGVIECSGSNLSGQAPAMKAAATSKFLGASAGSAHTCALRNDKVIECWGNDTNGQAPATRSALETRIKPTATFSAPASVIAGLPISVTLTNPTMPGFPLSRVFTYTYAFDCGTGFAAATATASVNCPTTASGGTLTVKGKVIDQDGDFSEYTKTITVVSVSAVLTQLKTEIATASGVTSSLRNPLTVKLNAAQAALKKNQITVACGALGDFRSQVTERRGNGIPTATADAWLATVATISSALGCP